jgi:hypothetical protein
MLVKLLGIIMALCAALVALPAPAQEGAPAAGADVPQAGGGSGDGAAMKGPAPDGTVLANRDIEPFTPQRGSAGLSRRANLKTLIANAPKAAGSPPANARIAPPMRPGIDAAAPRNAIGVAMPGERPSGHDTAGVTTQAGRRLTGIGTPAGNVGRAMHHVPVPINVSPALYGAAINGTTMGHIASRPGSIGGPAKDRSGINGTLMRPKH